MSICLLQMSCSLGPWRWNALDSSKHSLMKCQKKQTRDHVQLGPKVKPSNIPFFSCFHSTSHDVAATGSFCMLKYSSAARTSAPSAVWFTASIDWESMAIEVPVESWDLSCEISEATSCCDFFSEFCWQFQFHQPAHTAHVAIVSLELRACIADCKAPKPQAFGVSLPQFFHHKFWKVQGSDSFTRNSWLFGDVFSFPTFLPSPTATIIGCQGQGHQGLHHFLPIGLGISS